MFHSYTVLFLSLLFTYSITIDIQKQYANRTIASSRSIYDLVQIRRAAARWTTYHNKTHPKNHINDTFFHTNSGHMYLPRSKITDFKDNHDRFLVDRLKIIIVISSISLCFMILIVISCIGARYFHSKHPIPTERIEQTKPLHPSGRTRFSEAKHDTRNFSRKPRIVRTTV